MELSAAARVLVRPFRGYEALAKDAPTITEGALRLLFVIGAVVAVTATGRLAPLELVVAMGSFAYVPIVQLVALSVPLRAVARQTSIKRAFALYLAGHGPAIVVLLVIAFVALLAPAESTAAVLLRVVPLLVLAMLLWGSFMTYACFRSGLGLSRLRAGIGVALHFVVVVAVVVGYFLAMGQLGPQLWM